MMFSATSSTLEVSRASIRTQRKSLLNFQSTFIAIVVAPEPGSCANLKSLTCDRYFSFRFDFFSFVATYYDELRWHIRLLIWHSS